jgi:hypothetical protein
MPRSIDDFPSRAPFNATVSSTKKGGCACGGVCGCGGNGGDFSRVLTPTSAGKTTEEYVRASKRYTPEGSPKTASIEEVKAAGQLTKSRNKPPTTLREPTFVTYDFKSGDRKTFALRELREKLGPLTQRYRGPGGRRERPPDFENSAHVPREAPTLRALTDLCSSEEERDLLKLRSEVRSILTRRQGKQTTAEREQIRRVTIEYPWLLDDLPRGKADHYDKFLCPVKSANFEPSLSFARVRWNSFGPAGSGSGAKIGRHQIATCTHGLWANGVPGRIDLFPAPCEKNQFLIDFVAGTYTTPDYPPPPSLSVLKEKVKEWNKWREWLANKEPTHGYPIGVEWLISMADHNGDVVIGGEPTWLEKAIDITVLVTDVDMYGMGSLGWQSLDWWSDVGPYDMAAIDWTGWNQSFTGIPMLNDDPTVVNQGPGIPWSFRNVSPGPIIPTKTGAAEQVRVRHQIHRDPSIWQGALLDTIVIDHDLHTQPGFSGAGLYTNARLFAIHSTSEGCGSGVGDAAWDMFLEAERYKP